SPSVFHSKLEQIPELGGQDKERQEAAGKRDKREGGDGAPGLDAPKSKGAELEAGKTERKEIEVSSVQSSPSPKQGDLPRDAKAEEPKAAEAVSGNDITAPPNKELPPSPEKKSKVGAVPCSHLCFQGFHFPAFLLPQLCQPKFCSIKCLKTAAVSAHLSLVWHFPPRCAAAIPAPLTPPAPFQVADAKPAEKRTSLSKPPSSTTPKTPSRSSSAAPRTTAPSPVTAAA
ncbi:MAP4 protein, partial [Chloropsis hardwickii]|nr:MAP4 protein [Chloropsis hardwickii]